MKSTLFTIGSAALFSSVITALPTVHTPRAASTVDIVIKTGDGDSSAGITVPVGRAVAATEIGSQQALSGVAASLSSDATISCMAFSDADATIPLVDASTQNSVFTSVISVQFGISSGGTESVITDAVPIGAYCCVPTEEGFAACDNSAAAVTTLTPTDQSQSKGKTVRVQLNGESELSAQSEVPADNSLFLIAAHPPLFSDVISALIEDAEGLNKPSCTAFSDSVGKNAVGSITETESKLNQNGKTVKVVALKCKSN